MSSYSRVRGSHFRLPRAAPLHCPKMLPLAPPLLPLAPSLLPPAPPLLPPAPSLLSPAPSLLPLKRPCSLSRPRTAISNPKFGVYIIYIIYTPNLRLRVAVFIQEREQGRFRGSSEGARESSEGALREHQGSTEGARGIYGAVQGRSRWEPEMAS